MVCYISSDRHESREHIIEGTKNSSFIIVSYDEIKWNKLTWSEVDFSKGYFCPFQKAKVRVPIFKGEKAAICYKITTSLMPNWSYSCKTMDQFQVFCNHDEISVGQPYVTYITSGALNYLDYGSMIFMENSIPIQVAEVKDGKYTSIFPNFIITPFFLNFQKPPPPFLIDDVVASSPPCFTINLTITIKHVTCFRYEYRHRKEKHGKGSQRNGEVLHRIWCFGPRLHELLLISSNATIALVFNCSIIIYLLIILSLKVTYSTHKFVGFPLVGQYCPFPIFTCYGRTQKTYTGAP
ncbi:unnamed protein product [Lactuca saligna]|uniref:Uncharacterized protein n=1 Tax=Lactuca saligna TaxID=75948 RepID=A0AA35Z788_LACSI|nr:unnamed protein product [Lactuca saligna]